MEDLTGKQLGAYQIIAPLGEGGMAAVYKAYQPSMERYIALKVLPRHYAADPDFIGRFKQEAKVIASLEHPRILPVYDYGEAEGYTYLAMRLVEGGSLADLLHGKPLLLARMRRLIPQIGDALDYAHSKGIVHRDVKPSNVLMDERGNCLLTDFGIAKILASTTRFTTVGAFTGTPAYASPEQCLGSDLDRRSDVYSLGVMLYEMATGRPPFDAETPMAIVMKHVHDPLPLPRSLNPALSEAFERVILKALAKDREDRYQTVSEMVRAFTTSTLKEARRETTLPETRPQPSATIKALPKQERRIPWWGWVLTSIAILGVLVGLLQDGMAPVATVARGTPTAVSAARPSVAATVLSAPSRTEAILVSTPVPSTPIQEPSSTPPEPEITSMPVQAYGIPFNGPWDIIYDGSALWMLFDGLLVRLELVEAEGRFRAAQQQAFPVVNSLAWDASRGKYWTVRGDPDWADEHIDLVDRIGNTAATFTIPQTFVGFPRNVAWDGENVWLTSVAEANVPASWPGSLYRLRPLGEGELEVIDTYAQPRGLFGDHPSSGLTWDGSHLWLLVDNVLVKLDRTGQTVCRIDSLPSDLQYLWWRWRGVAWDGQFLWAANAEASQAFRVDPAECR